MYKIKYNQCIQNAEADGFSDRLPFNGNEIELKMKTFRIKAYAKINLGLDVLRADRTDTMKSR